MNRALSYIYDKKHPVTSVLLIVTTLVFLAMQILYFGQSTTALAVYDFGGMLGRVVMYDPSQLWRLVTPIFVHIGLEHFLMNMLSLYFIGRMVEDIFGSAYFLAIYFISGLVGNAFTLFFTPDVVAAGASTSLFGMFGAIALLGTAVNNQYIKALGRNYTALIVFNIIFGLFDASIGMAGHLGGLVGGLLCAVIFPIRFEKGTFQVWQRLLATVALIALLAFLVGVPLTR